MTRETPEPIVFLPGLLCTELLFAPQIAAFADRPILIGATRGPDTITDMATATLAAAPDCFALVGLSMGGYVAFEILRQAPNRVSRLALLDTSARADTAEQIAKRETLIDLAERGAFATVPGLLTDALLAPSHRHDHALRVVIRDMAMDVGVRDFIAQERAIMERADSRADLRDIRCPTLVLCGEEDTLTPPPLAHEIADSIPDAKLAFVPNAGHLSTLEEPAMVTSLLRRWVGATHPSRPM